MNRPTAILIAGPTASGKSALALKLAREIDGVIVNADSMQVYRDLRVITARPTVEEEARAAPPALRPCGRGGELFGRPLAADARRRLPKRREQGRCRSSSAARGFISWR